MFHFKQSITKRHYFIVNCVDRFCDWRVRAKEVGDCGYYEITKASLAHTCCIDTRNAYRKKVSSRVIAAVFRAKYMNFNKGPRSTQLQRMVLEDLHVQASYMKCYRAIEQTSIDVRGTKEESYLKLHVYFYLLKAGNPAGFSRLRRVIVVDGTHLWGKYKGVLLTVVGQDANFQVFPLAYALVDSENTEAWTWFLERLERILGDSSSLVIVSDRWKALYPAIGAVYPLAVHVACIVHLSRNVSSIYSSKGHEKLVSMAAFAYRPATFKPFFEKIKSRNLECARYLEKIAMSFWARCYCKGEMYNFMTSNAAEQLN
ncbi:unnamed protein product [Microthlaspi erraticum]|uniref:MULE transposase domain-containing protein n=1 Tax=Microthlaspi erraticum TaxID=1685480 RepID=A0A6D2IK29_9BRAS|nr:unnamed protein product [Microthlaspi erraticum]